MGTFKAGNNGVAYNSRYYYEPYGFYGDGENDVMESNLGINVEIPDLSAFGDGAVSMIVKGWQGQDFESNAKVLLHGQYPHDLDQSNLPCFRAGLVLGWQRGQTGRQAISRLVTS
ncbi:MAG: hypothetical protein QM749_03835 [Aquabacterium sp.]